MALLVAVALAVALKLALVLVTALAVAVAVAAAPPFLILWYCTEAWNHWLGWLATPSLALRREHAVDGHSDGWSRSNNT